jgi:hypothetical protein
MENANTPKELQKIVEQVIQNLQQLPPVPSVGISDVPPPIKVGVLVGGSIGAVTWPRI